MEIYLRFALGIISEKGQKLLPKSNKMIGIIWNCRGVSKKGMSTFLNELMFDYHADFIGLQETIKRKIH